VRLDHPIPFLGSFLLPFDYPTKALGCLRVYAFTSLLSRPHSFRSPFFAPPFRLSPPGRLDSFFADGLIRKAVPPINPLLSSGTFLAPSLIVQLRSFWIWLSGCSQLKPPFFSMCQPVKRFFSLSVGRRPTTIFVLSFLSTALLSGQIVHWPCFLSFPR